MNRDRLLVIVLRTGEKHRAAIFAGSVDAEAGSDRAASSGVNIAVLLALVYVEKSFVYRARLLATRLAIQASRSASLPNHFSRCIAP